MDINNYVGSKTASGIQQFIINRIPKCYAFYEMFGGAASITRKLLQSDHTVDRFFIYEISNNVVSQLFELIIDANVNIFQRDSFEILESVSVVSKEVFEKRVIYCDPPYVLDSRRSGRSYYENEWQDSHHVEFLQLCKQLRAKGALIIISMYDHPLYKEHLHDWFIDSTTVMTRRGKVKEFVYMSYDINKLPLATYDYVGHTFTDRQRIKRKKERLVKKLNNLPYHEKLAMLQHIQNELLNTEL